MKRLIVILMALALTMAVFTACAGNTGNDNPADSGEPDIAADDPDGDSDSGSDKPAQPGDSSEEYLRTITEETATAKGECGNDLKWYYKDGVLVIKGTGEMTDYYSDAYEDHYAPWVTYNDGEIKDEISLVVLGDGVTSVGEIAFYGLDLLSRAVLPDSLVEIGQGAFFNCGSLTSVNFPDSLEVIGDEAFSHCGSLASVSFPESLKVIGREAFNECFGLTSVIIPATVEEIGYNAFAYTHNVTDITLCEGLTEVDLGDFWNVKSVVIPAGVTKIVQFGGQEEITFLGDAPEIATWEAKNSADEVIGTVIHGLPTGIKYDEDTKSFLNEPEETGTTIYYSGEGFEKYIELCPQYNWVKK